ncbi:MAG TPA: protein-glutamate O-methyltransferase CheR [Tepidisphaeraceae bacterium]
MSAIVQRLRAGRFRHVVFATGMGMRRARNLAAPATEPLERVEALQGEPAAFLRWLFRRGGLDVNQYRPETLNRRLPACLRALRTSDVREARELINSSPELTVTALSALVIGVTSFFRDAATFDELTYHVLPSRKHSRSAALRIWSVGCSDGAEPYSIAILLAELDRLEGATILGTDCRADAVVCAREGLYDDHAVRDVPQVWLEKYFKKERGHWRLCQRVRDAVQYRTADMTQITEPGTWDVILCRNVCMYFKPECAGRMWERFESSLTPGGFLVLGKAERPTGTKRLSGVGPCIYRRDRG